MLRAGLLALALGTAMLAAEPPMSDLQPDLRLILVRDLKFSSGELADLEHGKVVRHTLPVNGVGEVAVVGGIRIHATRERFLAAYRDIVRFKRGASILEIGRFSSTPVLTDLDGLTIDRDDFDLRACQVGDCDIRLPASDIHRFASEVDWTHPDADARAAALFKQILLDNVHAYATGGAGRIAQYDDDKRTIMPVEDFKALLKNSPYIEAALPGLGAHVADYPAGPLPGAEDFLYWSKEKFGIAPFISVTHVTIAPSGAHQVVVTTRDVYSSRYVDASLALAIASDSVSDPGSFYLFYVNRARANALRGPFSRLRRSIVERRAKASLEENLKDVKQRLE
jgi:hypothetical protein